MSVYVDPLFGYGGSATFKWKDSCHMFADTLEELHAFAKAIGLRREWFQMSRSGLPHYDLNGSRRDAAVRRGAVEMEFDAAYSFWVSKGWTRRKVVKRVRVTRKER